MIKINISGENLNTIAESHYNNIESIITKRLKAWNKRKKSFKTENILIEYITKNLKNIIIAKPHELNKIINDVEQILDVFSNKKSIRRINGEISKIFNYEAFRDNYKSYGAYDLSKKININVCPYCNRNYTFTLKSNEGKTRPEFDHFFDRASYPYLSLSFYNLVPSCHTCNSNLKGSNKFCLDHNIHPYLEGFENVLLFTTSINSSNFLQSLNFDIKLVDKYDLIESEEEIACKAKNNTKVFLLEELYNEHKEIACEIITKSIVYNENRKQELMGLGIFKDEHELMLFILANYTSVNDFGKRPLSKFTRDIAVDCGLLKIEKIQRYL